MGPEHDVNDMQKGLENALGLAGERLNVYPAIQQGRAWSTVPQVWHLWDGKASCIS